MFFSLFLKQNGKKNYFENIKTMVFPWFSMVFPFFPWFFPCPEMSLISWVRGTCNSSESALGRPAERHHLAGLRGPGFPEEGPPKNQESHGKSIGKP
jgi:hypothetical protein